VAESTLQPDMHSFYSSHHGWLFGWLRKKLGCAHNAADVAQDTFVRIIASRDALLGVQEPRAYLTATAKRLMLDRARRQLIEQSYLAELALTMEHAEAYPGPEEILLAVEALEQISAALQSVAANARDAFLLHYLDGQTHAEVAAALGVSTRMVGKYLVQVLVKCRLVQA
jgi:RNA polymerase sigma factor (sigma-70 family)